MLRSCGTTQRVAPECAPSGGDVELQGVLESVQRLKRGCESRLCDEFFFSDVTQARVLFGLEMYL